MIQKVTMPALGETVEVSTVERWLKQEGDAVSTGDVLCEITTDKATLEVESYYRGTLLKIVAPAGTELPVGALIAVIGDPGEAIPPDVLSAAPAAKPARPAKAAAAPAPKTPAPAAARPAAPAPQAAAGSGGFQRVTMPALGETVEVSTIERWVKQEGDAVAPGDILCEITTDKATLEVESYYRGTLRKIVAPAGAELPVGALIAVIGDPDKAIPPDVLAGAPAAAAAPAPKAVAVAAADPVASDPVAAPQAPGGRVFASPRARAAARECGVALERLRGTGPGGRIVEADVRQAAASGAPGAAGAVKASPLARKVAADLGVDLASVQGTGVGGKVMRDDVQRGPQPPRAAPAKAGEIVPLTAMRRIVAERMLLSKQTIPCYYLSMDTDMTDLACVRNKLNLKSNGKPKVSFNDFVIKACGLALKAFPQVNSRWVEGGAERRGVAHVGLAVALDEGLMVPVVRDADRKPIRQIARETADLALRARSKKLVPDEYQGGCMTVTNLGMFGIRSFVAVVNPGESTILGLGVIQDRVVFRQGGIQIRKIMTMTLSVDHRLVDGAVGAQFLEMIRDALEAPQRLVDEEE